MQFHPKDLSDLDDLTEEHLGFSALSDGLGFSKNAKKAPPLPSENLEDPAEKELARKALSGTGAVAAGPARPAPRAAGIPRSVSAPNVLAEPAAPQGIRVLAFLADFALIALPMILAWWISFRGDSLSLFRQDRATPLFLFGLIFAVYFLLSESFGGQSIGKMFFGLRVVEDDKYQKPTGLSHASKRLLLFVVGASCFGLGFFASFWDAKRRPWHDRYSGSIVRRKV